MRRFAWIERGFFAIAIALLGYCGFVLEEGWRFQNAEDSQFERLRQQPQAIAKPRVPEALPPAPDGVIGRLEIPRIGLSTVVMEGTARTTLRHAVGHIAGMALPGQQGNVGLAGHRDTYFRPLRNVREADVITLKTLHGEFRYRVVSIRTVSPRDVAVLDRGEGESLTLVTCYPFYFVGPAPNRFIVRAERVS